LQIEIFNIPLRGTLIASDCVDHGVKLLRAIGDKGKRKRERDANGTRRVISRASIERRFIVATIRA